MQAVRCRTPGCDLDAEPGRKWCLGHGEMYVRMRKELESGKDRRAPRFVGGRCGYYDCLDPRKPGARYCLRHERLLGR